MFDGFFYCDMEISLKYDGRQIYIKEMSQSCLFHLFREFDSGDLSVNVYRKHSQSNVFTVVIKVTKELSLKNACFTWHISFIARKSVKYLFGLYTKCSHSYRNSLGIITQLETSFYWYGTNDNLWLHILKGNHTNIDLKFRFLS